MKHKKFLKKITCLVLAMMLVLGMGITALATENVSIDNNGKTKPDITTHTFVAYKIFKGTQASGSSELGSIEWADDFDGDALLAKLTADTTIGNKFTVGMTAAQVAAAISEAGWTDDSAEARAFAKCVNSLTDAQKGTPISVSSGTTSLDPGYYLIVDITDVANKDDANNLSLLQLTNKGTFEIKNKTDIPTVEKKVGERNDSEADDETAYTMQDAADHDIGDKVPFELTGTLPADYDTYDTYKYVIHDKLSVGLTYDSNVEVYVKNGASETKVTGSFTIDTNVDADGYNLTVTCADLKKITGGATIDKDSKIIVKYTATLNENAVVGSTGNPNEVYLQYTNNHNADGAGGKTPTDKVIVFTYKVVANKVDKNSNPLEGAGFTLYKWSAKKSDWVAVGTEIKGDEQNPITKFEFKGVDAGKYKLEETTVPEGYNKADDIYFEVTANYSETADNPELKTLSVKVTDKDGNELTETGAPTITATVADGTLSTDVMNLSGVTLPETGGIGTTIFYLLGGILVLGCGAILVTRKRMDKR